MYAALYVEKGWLGKYLVPLGIQGAYSRLGIVLAPILLEESRGELARTGQLTVGGRLPCNTAGGLLSDGHLSGMNHIAEAVRQIRGTSPNQVPTVELSMVTGYGGAPHEAPPTVAYTAAILRK